MRNAGLTSKNEHLAVNQHCYILKIIASKTRTTHILAVVCNYQKHPERQEITND